MLTSWSVSPMECTMSENCLVASSMDSVSVRTILCALASSSSPGGSLGEPSRPERRICCFSSRASVASRSSSVKAAMLSTVVRA